MDKSVYNSRTKWATYYESSVRTPNFRDLVAKGEPLPLNPYVARRTEGISPRFPSPYGSGTVTERDASGIETFEGAAYTGHYTLQTGGKRSGSFMRVDQIHDSVIGKLTAGVRDYPVNLGQSLGEYRETARLLSGACEKLVPLVKALRKKDFSLALKTVTGRSNKRPSQAAQAAADAWLGWTYGVKPLASDIAGSMEALRRRGVSPQVEVGYVEEFFSQPVHGTAAYDVFGYRANGTVFGKLKGRGRIDFIVDNPLTFTLDQVGLTNPVALAWELIPLSFVFDWFVPVGNYLANVRPPSGLSACKGFTSVKGVGSTFQETDTSWGWYTAAATKSVFVDRKVFFDWPDVNLVVPDISLSRDKVISGVSLLTNAVFGVLGRR